MSPRAPDRNLRPIIAFVIFASGLEHVGLSTTALGWVPFAVLLAGGAVELAYVRPGRSAAPADEVETSGTPGHEVPRERPG